MSFTATSRRIGESLRQEIDVNGRHTIYTDEPESLGGDDTAPTPHELLPAILASCVTTMVSLYAMNKGWHVGDLSAEVNYDNEAEPRQFDVTLNLPEGLTDDQVARLRKVADTCPVRRALEAEVNFDERVEIGMSKVPSGAS